MSDEDHEEFVEHCQREADAAAQRLARAQQDLELAEESVRRGETPKWLTVQEATRRRDRVEADLALWQRMVVAHSGVNLLEQDAELPL